MATNWKPTAKRRENLVKICLNILTVDLAGVVIPFVLKPHEMNVSILFAAALGFVLLSLVIYLLES